MRLTLCRMAPRKRGHWLQRILIVMEHRMWWRAMPSMARA